MQTLFGQPPASRHATIRAVRILDRVLSANGVTRARDLPEEARVRLYRQLALFLEEERNAEWERRINGSFLHRCGRWVRDAMEALMETLQT